MPRIFGQAKGATGTGTVTNVTASSPLSSSGGTTPNITIANAAADGSTLGAATFTAADFNDNGSGLISIDYTNGQAADGTHKGFLTSTDWTTFNNKQTAGNYITALTGDITASGPGSVAATLATVNSNVGSFGSSTAIPSFTVNGKGLITAASTNVVIAPAGTLTGTTLNATVVTSSLTTVGTIATGVWQGTKVGLAYGGTNADLSATGGSSQVLKQTSVGGAVTVAQLAASDLSNGVQGSGAVVLATSPTITTAVLGSSTATTQTPADNSTKLATTAYVDNAVLGQRQKEAVKYASIAALPSIVYANGSSGVGATLTGVALAAISLDSSSPAVNDRVLIKNQVSTFQNGIYTVTATGSGIAVFVLTRTTDFDQASDIQTGDSVFVTAGSTLANTTWTYNGIDSPTMGTTAITFVQAAGPGSFTAGNGITITGTSIAIDTSVTVDKTTVQTLTNKTLTSPTIAKIGNLTTNGFVTTSGGDGTLGVDTTTYLASLSVKEDGSAVSSATIMNFIEPDATLVTDSPTGTARVDMSKYPLLAGRAGDVGLILSTNGNGAIYGTTVDSTKYLSLNMSNVTTVGANARIIAIEPFVTAVNGIWAPMYFAPTVTVSGAARLARINCYTASDSTWTIASSTNVVEFFGFTLSPTIINTNGTAITTKQIISLNATPKVQADGATHTITLHAAVYDQPAFTTVNAGALVITSLTAVDSKHAVPAAGTVSVRRGLYWQNGGLNAAATVTTSVGMDVTADTISSKSYTIRSVGTTVMMAHAGQVKIGATGDPTQALDVTGQGLFTDIVTAANFTANATTIPAEGMYRPTGAGNLGFAVSGAAELLLTATAFSPAVDGGNALGTGSLKWANLFLSSGGIIDFNNGAVTLTHATNKVTVAGGGVVLAAGTATAARAPLKFQSGTNNTTTEAGAIEYDGVQLYKSDTATGTRRKLATVDYGRVSGSDFTTTSTSLVSITGVSIPIDANEVWAFYVSLSVNGSTNTGMIYGINGPTGAVVEAIAIGSGATINTTGHNDRINALNTATTNFGVFTGDAQVIISGTMTASSTAGTLQIQIGRTSSGTGKVYINSHIRAFRIA